MRFWSFLLITVFVLACKKDVDSSPPTVTIQSPVDGLQASVFDQISMTINVADNEALDRIELKLVDVNLISAMPTGTQSLSGTGSTVNIIYSLDDITLATGQYYLQATVFDKEGNSSRDYVMLYVTAVPLNLEGFFAVTTTPGFVTLHRVDSAWNLSTHGTYQGDFTDLAMSSWWQQVAFTGAYTGMLQVISLDGQHPGWTDAAFPSSGPYWGRIIPHGRDWLINYRADGIIQTKSWSGNIVSTNNANSGYFFRNFTWSGDKLFADMVDVTGNSRMLGVYLSSGAAAQTASMNLDPVELFPRDETTIYAVGNYQGQGKLLIYDYDQSGFWEPIALPAGQVLSCCQVDVNTLLIGMDNGTVYEFTYSPVGLVTYVSATAQELRYNEADGTVITVEGTSIKEYDYPQTGILNQVVLPDTALDVELWYNR